MVEYPSIELTLIGWCADRDDTFTGPIWFVFARNWNLLHPTPVD
jgi:hypothetical protein